MGMRVETVMLGPDTDQYAGRGQRSTSIGRIAAAARRVESLGFDGTTAPEAGHDPFLPLAIAAEHTDRVALGTNVAVAFPRSPMATAQVAWDLQALSNGRFNLGLGTQVKAHNVRRYAVPWTAAPGPRLRDYLRCMKAMFDAFQSGEKPDFESEHYQFTLMSPFFNPGPIEHPHVPIYIAAVNNTMARLSGELCDGLRLHPISTFAHTRAEVLPSVETGAKRSGRKLSDIDVIGAPFLAVGADEEEVERAKQALKQHIAFYASTPTYHSVLEFHGWMDVAASLHRLSRAGKWTEMPNQISDDMLEEWAIVATRDQFADELMSRCSDIYDTVLLDLPRDLWADEDWVRETVHTLQQP
ncbi:MAG: TIGR03617 family F420-dependent LLM class oxidoreductase [Dehalococcoidia bacterium]